MKYGVWHMIRIMLADDYEVVRQGLRRILESRQDWNVCGEASDGCAAVELAVKLKPDVVVMDVSMRELNGMEATRRIRQALPSTEALIFTACESVGLISEALAAGARGYILKSESGTRIIEAVEALAGRRPYFTPMVSEALLNAFLVKGTMREGSAFSPLTRRERAVIQLLAEGKGNKAVASELGISHKTVESHRSAIRRKLRLHSIADIVHYAIRNKLVEP
jgi:DNA-binding NarL/FixJ family response regulator